MIEGLRRGRIGSPHMLTLELCRVYHCPPLVLDEQPLDTVLAHLACLAAEAEYQKIERTRSQMRRRRR